MSEHKSIQNNSILSFFSRLVKQREFFIAAIDIVIIIALSIVYPRIFPTFANLHSVFLGISIEVIIAVGMTVLMVSGGFDMSAGSVLAFSGVCGAMVLKLGAPPIVAVFVGVLAGGVAGLMNGLVVAKLGINAFVTTLAGLSIFRGLTLILTQGLNISSLDDSFKIIGQGEFLSIQNPIWYALILIVIGDIALRKMKFFRQTYYIGGNEKAARLSGIDVDKIKILCYMFVGLLAGFAGIVNTARFGSASVTAGTGLELRVITAVIIGGASLQGGEGTVLGAFFGSLLMALITAALNMIGVDVYWHTFVIGLTLLVAVLIDQYAKAQKIKSKKNSERSV